MEVDIEDTLKFLEENGTDLARIGVAECWRPDLTVADVARVCYLSIEAVQSLLEEYHRRGLIGYFLVERMAVNSRLYGG